MWSYYWPILLIVASNVLYNIATKSTPQNANAFLSLTVTYLVGAVLCFGAYTISSSETQLIGNLKNLNYTSILLGFAIVGLEFGYICLYRAGWNISVGSLVANILLAIALIVVGLLLYEEKVSLQQIGGIVLCLLGLVLINKK